MPTTPNGLPYPTVSDAPNGPAAVQALAEAADKTLGLFEVVQSGDANPTGTATVTLPGLSISVTSTAAAVWEVTISADVMLTSDKTNIIELLSNGAAQPVQLVTAGPTGARIAGSKRWRVAGVDGAQTFTARTSNLATGTNSVRGSHTVMHARRVA